jgi:hypothetical protein
VYKDSCNRSVWYGWKRVTVLENEQLNHRCKERIEDDTFFLLQKIKGNIWFSTEYEGVYQFNGKLFKNYTLANGLQFKYNFY